MLQFLRTKIVELLKILTQLIEPNNQNNRIQDNEEIEDKNINREEKREEEKLISKDDSETNASSKLTPGAILQLKSSKDRRDSGFSTTSNTSKPRSIRSIDNENEVFAEMVNSNLMEMNGRYVNWFNSNIIMLTKSRWALPTDIAYFVAHIEKINCNIVAERERCVTTFYDRLIDITTLVNEHRRFPETVKIICVGQFGWQGVQKLITLLRTKDRSIAIHGRGSEASQSFQASSDVALSLEKEKENVMRRLMSVDQEGIFDRRSFERQFALAWRNE